MQVRRGAKNRGDMILIVFDDAQLRFKWCGKTSAAVLLAVGILQKQDRCFASELCHNDRMPMSRVRMLARRLVDCII